MANDEKTKIFKIYRTINAIAIGGKDNLFEYKNLVDEIISKGDYTYFRMCLYIRYKIDITIWKSIDEVKIRTWDLICFQTLNSLQQKLKILYKENLIFQNGNDFYSDNPKWISMTYSKLSSTYSLATQSDINFNITNNELMINLNENNVFNLEFKSIDFPGEPIIKSNLGTINSGTWSYLGDLTYKTPIDPMVAGDYLINKKTRDEYTDFNYLLNIKRDNYLGHIEEVDVWTENPVDYLKYISMTYSGPLSSTYSLMATQSHLSLDYYNGLLNIKFSNYPGLTGSTTPYLMALDIKSVKWTDNKPTNTGYKTGIDSGTFSYFNEGGFKLGLPINPFSKENCDYILTSTGYDNSKQRWKINFYIGEVESLLEDQKIYYRRSLLPKILGLKRTFLKATKGNSVKLFYDIDFNVSEEMNLYYRYRDAIKWLNL